MKKNNSLGNKKLGKYAFKRDPKTGKYIIVRTDDHSVIAIDPNGAVSKGTSARTAKHKAKKMTTYTNNVRRIYSRDGDEISAAWALVNLSKEKLKEKYKRYQEEGI